MNKILLKIFCLLSIFIGLRADDCIEVYKNNVLHRFVPVGDATDNFVRDIFPHWEQETFAVFDLVKDPHGIAIDLGAWIGTTSIWLSKNFSHVLAVEADTVSLECLEKNLKASDCSNVTICPRPISLTSETVFFGPRGSQLNQSISCIKTNSDKADDYSVKSITLKQLIHDYLFQKNLGAKPITFIKCDIEGGEENIIEDILYFAYHNKVKVYLSFHIDWWRSKKINEFAGLFKFFKTNCPSEDICGYLSSNPFASLLFEPIQSAEPLLKSNMPAVIIGYNQPTFIKNMVKQLEKYTSDIIIVDNNSTFPKLLEYYENDYKYTLLRQHRNFGYTIYRAEHIQKLVGDFYILTDPDLKFNANLPQDFIQKMLHVSQFFKAHKIGFALCIDDPTIRTDVLLWGKTIQAFEAGFWNHPVVYPLDPQLKIYGAPVDTTFCLVDRRNHSGVDYRMGGDFTCYHIPWHKDFRADLEEGEYENYLNGNNSTNWFK